MQIKQISNQNFADEWNNFIIKNSSPAAFLQSWQWGQFKKESLNEDVRYYGIFEDDVLISTALFIKRALPGGRFYLNCPKGPVFKCPARLPDGQVSSVQCQSILDLLMNEIKKTAKLEKIVFVRIAPPYENKNIKIQEYKNNNLIKPKILTHLMEPEKTILLDLTKTPARNASPSDAGGEDEILKSMHHKTRYNIRLADKKGIRIKEYLPVRQAGGLSKIDVFYDLLKQTAKRDKINIFDKTYYKNLINYFNNLQVTGYGLQVTLFIAKHNSAPLAAILLVSFGNTATYLHGASSDQDRNLMPNYLIQWTAIKWAKEKGYKFYDFWGIAATDAKNWQGITRFKRGFVNKNTGQEINYLGTFDYILNKKWYNLYRLGKIFTNLKT